jgi:putative transposase
MPRAARLDIAGVLQHVIVRGVEQRDIFLDDDDRQSFLDRFSNLLIQTGTECLAWSLMTNHAHMLLRPTKGKLGGKTEGSGLNPVQNLNICHLYSVET